MPVKKVCAILVGQTAAALRREANYDNRSLNKMVEILVLEGLAARNRVLAKESRR